MYTQSSSIRKDIPRFVYISKFLERLPMIAAKKYPQFFPSTPFLGGGPGAGYDLHHHSQRRKIIRPSVHPSAYNPPSSPDHLWPQSGLPGTQLGLLWPQPGLLSPSQDSWAPAKPSEAPVKTPEAPATPPKVCRVSELVLFLQRPASEFI